VIVLEQKDATVLKIAYDRLKADQVAYDSLKAEAVKKYVKESQPGLYNGLAWGVEQWQFSPDFKIMVPGVSAKSVCPPNPFGLYGTTTPASALTVQQ
jgi:hypothetical protein